MRSADLLRSADQAGAQAAIRYGIFFERDALLQLRIGQPLLVILVAGGVLLHVGDAGRFLLRFLLGFADDSVGGDAELHARQIFALAALGHIADFFADARGRIAVHHEGIALLRNQFLRRFRFPARVNRGARFRDRLRLQHQILHGMIFSGVGEMILLPGGVHDIEPLGSARVTIVVLIELHAIFFGFFGPPGGNHVQREAAVADPIDIRGLFREQRGQDEKWAARRPSIPRIR